MSWLPRRILLVGFLIAGGLSPTLAAEDPQVRYFDSLRERQLFSLAERYCLERLSLAGLPLARRSDLVLQLSRTFSQHALFAGVDQQEELSQRAESSVRDFLKQYPENPRRLLLETQLTLIPAERGQALRWQAELNPDDDALRKQAIQKLTEGVARMQEIDGRLAERARQAAPREAPTDGTPRPFELRARLYEVRYRAGVALLDRAELAPLDSADRVKDVIAAQEYLEPLAGGFPGETVTWNSQALLARCARLRGNPKRAVQIIESIQREHPPAEIGVQLVAEHARALLELNEPTEAARVLNAHTQIDEMGSGELAFLTLQALVALGQIAREKRADALARELQTETDKVLERLRTQIGGYWAALAETWSARAREEHDLGSELARLIRNGRTQYLDHHVPQAIESYSQAVAAAVKRGRPDLAFELEYTRAAIQLEAGLFTEAAAALQALAAQSPQQAKTPDAHLLAAYALGKFYEARKTQARRQAYTTALEEHQKRFAGHPTAGEAAWMHGQFEEWRLQTTAALKHYLEIPPAHPRAPEAQIAIARCYEKILERVRELKQPVAEWESEAIAALSRMLPAPNSMTPLTAGQAEVAVRLARILQERTPADYAASDKLLSRALAVLGTPPGVVPPESNPQADAHRNDLRKTALQLRIVALAGQGELDEARHVLGVMTAAGPADLLPVLDGLTQLVSESSGDLQQRLGDLQREAVLGLNRIRDRLTPPQKQNLDRCLAQAYAVTGQVEQARAVYQTLLAAKPDDPQLQSDFAHLLLKCGTPACLEPALPLLRKLESRHKPGTPAWLEARLHVAECVLGLGQPQQCLKLIEVTRVLYPELGGGVLQARFAELEARCRKR